MKTIKNSAMAYRNAGTSILPIFVETKAPALKIWKDRQKAIPAPDVIEKDFSRNGRGIGMVCGEVSGNLECLDFDQQAAMFRPLQKLVDAEAPGLINRLVMQNTQNGGCHVVYRCESEVPGGKKLASDKDGHVLIETQSDHTGTGFK